MTDIQVRFFEFEFFWTDWSFGRLELQVAEEQNTKY